MSAIVQVSNTTTRTATVELSGPVSKRLVVEPKESLPLTIPPGKCADTIMLVNLRLDRQHQVGFGRASVGDSVKPGLE